MNDTARRAALLAETLRCELCAEAVITDDAEREFDYTAGADKALELAKSSGWAVASTR